MEDFCRIGPHKRGYRLEVPMEHIAKSVEYLFRTFSDESVAMKGIEPSSLLRAVNTSEYENHMAAISYMLKEEIRAARDGEPGIPALRLLGSCATV